MWNGFCKQYIGVPLTLKSGMAPWLSCLRYKGSTLNASLKSRLSFTLHHITRCPIISKHRARKDFFNWFFFLSMFGCTYHMVEQSKLTCNHLWGLKLKDIACWNIFVYKNVLYRILIKQRIQLLFNIDMTSSTMLTLFHFSWSQQFLMAILKKRIDYFVYLTAYFYSI